MRKPVQYREANARPTPVAAPAAAPAPTPTAIPSPVVVSFATDILPIFAPFAAAMMWRFDLTDYPTMKANASIVSGRISADGGMPPQPFPPLSDHQVQLFNAWIAGGCKP